MRRSALVSGIVVLILFALAIGIWYAVISEDRGGKLTVSFLNVGQGDAIFIDAPSGRQALIDGGRGRVVLRELARASPWWDRSIDVVVATHPDLDHIGGLPDVLARYRVGLVMRSSVLDEGSADSAAFDAAADAEAKQGAALLVAKRGQIIDLGGGASMEVLYPDRDVSGVETNAGSIVARLVYGETAFMLTGDAPQAIEEYLALLDGKELHSNVLKAGHHGSKTSSSPLFLGYVAPEYAVFSRGCDNKYGHPAQETVERFAQFGIPAFDTCKDGTVTFVSDGQTVVRE